MADAAVEMPQTAGAEKDVKSTGAETKPTESTSNGKSGEKEPKATNGEKQADEDDEFERYGSDKRDRGERRSDRRDRDDYKRRDHDDRGRRNDRGRGRGRGGNRGRGGGRGGYDNNRFRNNIKTRYDRKEESSDATEIRRQIEFYFSDSNLPVDNYLLQEVGGSENRPFPLKTIHNFKRMRHYQPFSAIVEAVKGSTFLGVNDQDEVYRKRPLAKHFTLDVEKNAELLTSDSMARSIYAKGFGEEEADTQFKVEEFFQPYGGHAVRLRREKDGTFKGSVFVEFENEDAAKQFLEMEEKPKYDDNELEVKSKKEYVDQKSQDIRDGKVKPNSPTRHSSYHRNDRRDCRDNRDKGGYKRKRNYEDEDDVDRDDWRERRDRFQKKGRRDSRSRSRSPYRAEKPDEKEADAKSEEKKIDDEKPEEKKAEDPKAEEPKAEEQKPEEAKEEAKAEAAA